MTAESLGRDRLGRNALDRIAQLERELAEARMDTARLDWLAKTDNAALTERGD